MNDWDYHKKEFTHLGGIINNLTCREGENGRGVFRQGRPVKPKIICPPNLLTKLDDIVLVRGELRLNKNSNHSREARDFIESYYEKFSWGDTGKKEAATFLYEITQLPINAKKFLLDNKLCNSEDLNTKADLKMSFKRFFNSRAVKFKKTPVLAPIWELVNHSPFSHSFRKTEFGVETPNYRADSTIDEIFHAYKTNSSPISIFFNYGFASNEIFAYSLPMRIKSTDGEFEIKIEGFQKDYERNSKYITLDENTLTIPSLPIGSISKGLPNLFFDAITKKYDIKAEYATGSLDFIQEINIQKRRELKAMLVKHSNTTTKSLMASIDLEIDLIKRSSRLN